MLQIFVGRKSRAIGGNLKEHTCGLTEVDRLKVVALDDGCHLDRGPGNALPPLLMLLHIGRAKRDVMDSTNPRTSMACLRSHIQMYLRSRTTFTYLIDQHISFLIGLIAATLPEAQYPGHKSGAWLNFSDDKPHSVQAANGHLGRHRALCPGVTLQSSLIVYQFETLTLWICEGEYCLPIFSTHLNAFMRHFERVKAFDPPFQCVVTVHPQHNGGYGARARTIHACSRKIKKGQFCARVAAFISIKDMIGGDIILVHGLLDHA